MWSFNSISAVVVLTSVYVECCRSSVRPPPLPLSAPMINDTKMHYPNILTVFWESIPEDQIEKEHPILGYKVSLWVDNRVSTHTFKNGKLVTKYEYRPKKVHNRVPDTPPTILTADPNQTSVNFTKIIPNTVYQVRVRAFNDVGDGFYSLPHNFRLIESKEEREKRVEEEERNEREKEEEEEALLNEGQFNNSTYFFYEQ